MPKTVRFQVAITVPNNVPDDEIVAYVNDGVRTMRGCYNPEAAINLVDDDEIVITKLATLRHPSRASSKKVSA